MRTTRNPRYAPEFLERKLSPTDLVGGITATALVSTMAPADADAANDPPPPPPPPPTGPGLPG